MTDAQPDLRWLRDYLHPQGGVAYLAARQPRIEPTAFSVLAAVAREVDVDWLKKKLPTELILQGGPPRDLTGSILDIAKRPWLVALGIVALSRANTQHVLLDIPACVEYLHDNHAADAWGNLKNLARPELAGALPWNIRNYGWIEPTCWGLLAELALLAVASQNDEREMLAANIAARIEFLMTRKVSDHGWNNGDMVKFGDEIPAHPRETAMVLAALAGVRNFEQTAPLLPADFDAAASFALLERLQANEESRLTQSWSYIAGKAWNQPSAQDVRPPISPPTIGESSVDVLLSLAAHVGNLELGFNFLSQKEKP